MQVSELEPIESVKSLAMVRSRTVVGVDAVPVVVEVHLANGLPCFSTVGLPETAVKESKDRVRGAIVNSGFEFPAKRITVNLAPADLPKHGGRFDLPIAIGILVASGQLPGVNLNNLEFVGELALNGQLRKVSGMLPTALACGRSKSELIIPSSNAAEASLASSTTSFHAQHLLQVCKHLIGQGELLLSRAQPIDCESVIAALDLSDVRGQPHAKRAIEIAASGGHSMIFVGPPGTGKSMLASRINGILPPLNQREALETAAIQSVAFGEFDISMWQQRPFRSPHHSSSSAALVGGGSVPKPGEISKAHNGVLFLDELTEFSRSALEQLREPLETGEINIARASQAVSYPAKFMLVAACNPCRCGYAGDGTDRCKCTPTSVENYRSKISGPLMDRIDMHVHLPRVNLNDLRAQSMAGECSKTVMLRVVACRDKQMTLRGKLSSELSASEIERFCELNAKEFAFLVSACEKLNLSARAFHRILKLARTIADMSDSPSIERPHLAEALSYRSLDRA